MDGWFRYEHGGQIREVNVLQLAAANGQISAKDPTIASLLGKIQAAMATTGVINTTSDPLLDSYVYQSPGKLFEHQPTLRVDYNINDNHRLSGSYAVIWAERDPDYLNGVDARFPGAPNYRFFHSKRPLGTLTLRSTLSKDIVNELKFGITAKGGASYFGDMSEQRSADLRGPGRLRDRLRREHRPDQLVRDQRAELAQRADLRDHQLDDLAEEHAQPDVRRHLAPQPGLGERAADGAGHQPRASTPTATRPPGCSTRRTSRTPPAAS